MSDEPDKSVKTPAVALIEAAGNVLIALLSGRLAMTVIICATVLAGWFATLLDGDERAKFINQGGVAEVLESLATKLLSSALIPVSGWLAAGVIAGACYAVHRAQHAQLKTQGDALARLRDATDPDRASSRRISPKDEENGP